MIQWRSKLIVLASITNLHKGLCQGHSLILLGASKVAESAVHSSLSPVRILPLPRAPLDFFLNHLSLPLLQALTSDLIASDCNEVSSPFLTKLRLWSRPFYFLNFTRLHETVSLNMRCVVSVALLDKIRIASSSAILHFEWEKIKNISEISNQWFCSNSQLLFYHETQKGCTYLQHQNNVCEIIIQL